MVEDPIGGNAESFWDERHGKPASIPQATIAELLEDNRRISSADVVELCSAGGDVGILGMASCSVGAQVAEEEAQERRICELRASMPEASSQVHGVEILAADVRHSAFCDRSRAMV
jgi:hypothetical protein